MCSVNVAYVCMSCDVLSYETSSKFSYDIIILTLMMQTDVVVVFQVIGMCHIFSNDHPEKARVMVWVLGGLTGLAG